VFHTSLNVIRNRLTIFRKPLKKCIFLKQLTAYFLSYIATPLFITIVNININITPILKSLHWLKMNEKTKYKVLSLTYKSLKTGQSSYIRSLLSFSSHRCIESSSPITLSRPSLTSPLKIANRSFYHSAPVLWNNLPSYLRQVVHHVTPSPISNSPVSDLPTSLFLKTLKTHLFHSSFPP